jgi:hypothetical protein
MAGERQTPELKLAPATGDRTLSSVGLLSSGVPIECTLCEVAHPEGRFRRLDGSRYDGADTQPGVVRLGNVRQTSFRLQLISPAPFPAL